MVEKKLNHQAKVVRVGEPRVHTNADTLELLDIPNTDYQVVVKKGEFKAGDLAVYIQPDSIVPQTEPFKFIWEGHIGLDGTVPEKRRRITVRKFRKEWSEGLLLSVSSFAEFDRKNSQSFVPSNGEDVSDILGITHYVPPDPIENFNGQQPKPYKWLPKSIRGWFFFILRLIGLDPENTVGGRPAPGPKNSPQVYDVDALKNYKDAFVDGEPVIATEKIHGSNARFQFSNGKMFAGSHYQWKHPSANCIWNKVLQQHPWIEKWCRKNEGYTLYGEVTPTQEGFRYGTQEDQTKFFVFDVMKPDGKFFGWDDFFFRPDRKTNDIANFYPLENDSYVHAAWVPMLYRGPFEFSTLKKLADGESEVPGAKSIREGIVVQPTSDRHVRGIGRLKLKLVSNAFLEKDNK